MIMTPGLLCRSSLKGHDLEPIEREDLYSWRFPDLEWDFMHRQSSFVLSTYYCLLYMAWNLCSCNHARAEQAKHQSLVR